MFLGPLIKISFLSGLLIGFLVYLWGCLVSEFIVTKLKAICEDTLKVRRYLIRKKDLNIIALFAMEFPGCLGSQSSNSLLKIIWLGVWLC